MTRKYTNMPDPMRAPESFNHYLRQNNEVVHEGLEWITIKNSYIPGQLVIFCLRPVRNMTEYYNLKATTLDGTAGFASIFQDYDGHHIYINEDSDRSVPNRFHVHVKMQKSPLKPSEPAPRMNLWAKLVKKFKLEDSKSERH